MNSLLAEFEHALNDTANGKKCTYTLASLTDAISLLRNSEPDKLNVEGVNAKTVDKLARLLYKCLIK